MSKEATDTLLMAAMVFAAIGMFVAQVPSLGWMFVGSVITRPLWR